MNLAHLWMQPTSVSPAHRYTYDASRKFGEDKRMYSDCGMWISPYSKSQVLPPEHALERCSHCVAGTRCTGLGTPLVEGPRAQRTKTPRRKRRSAPHLYY